LLAYRRCLEPLLEPTVKRREVILEVRGLSILDVRPAAGLHLGTDDRRKEFPDGSAERGS
jgi:hypothetical protein